MLSMRLLVPQHKFPACCPSEASYGFAPQSISLHMLAVSAVHMYTTVYEVEYGAIVQKKLVSLPLDKVVKSHWYGFC